MALGILLVILSAMVVAGKHGPSAPRIFRRYPDCIALDEPTCGVRGKK